jgi:hypothetical protein
MVQPLSTCRQAWSRRHCLEAQGLPLCVGTFPALDQIKEPECAGSEARSRERLPCARHRTSRHDDRRNTKHRPQDPGDRSRGGRSRPKAARLTARGMVRVRLERDSTTQCDAVVREGVSVSRCVCPAADLAQLIWPEARNRPRLADLAAVAYDASSNVIGMRAFRGADVIREALHADDDEAGRDGRSSNKSPAARCSPHRLRCSRPPLERWGAAAVAGRARRTETATRSPLHPIPPVRRAW